MAPTTLNASDHRGMGSTKLPEMLERLCFIPTKSRSLVFLGFLCRLQRDIFLLGTLLPQIPTFTLPSVVSSVDVMVPGWTRGV